jgi:hypothetical protein
MQIEHFRSLILNLPVKQQSFTTKRSTWFKAENELKEINNVLFGDQLTLTNSRYDILETIDLKELIIKTIYWGYPNGMRGNNFVNIINQIDLIIKEINKLKEIQNPTSEDFKNLSLKFKTISGLGLSTYSKILYFSKIKFDNNPCLILDDRLIKVFAKENFIDFVELNQIRYSNAESKYLIFLKKMNEVAANLGTRGENLEQFLFIFGNNLKNI